MNIYLTAAYSLIQFTNLSRMVIFFIFSSLLFILIVIISAKKLYFDNSPADKDINGYVKELEGQLNEVTSDYNNKQISKDEFNATKFEINKRLLKEIRAGKNGPDTEEKAPDIFSNIFLYFLIPLLILGTSTIYLKLGYYGFEDQPQKTRELKEETYFAKRLNQQQAELLLEKVIDRNSLPPKNIENEQLKTLVDRLEIILKDRPKDFKGYSLLVDNAARLGDYKTSYEAQKQIVENINSTVSADDYGKLAELMISATNGYVSIEAEENIKKSLHVNPSDQRARYYYGLLKLQKNKFEEGYTIWKNLMKEDLKGTPWGQLIKQDLTRLEQLLEEKEKSYQKPLKETVNTETMEMINEMVSNLSRKLEIAGGTSEDWIKLVRSYLVLGKKDQALETLKKAIGHFYDQPDVIKKLQEFEILTRE